LTKQLIYDSIPLVKRIGTWQKNGWVMKWVVYPAHGGNHPFLFFKIWLGFGEILSIGLFNKPVGIEGPLKYVDLA
jgi:hypothetical protein